MLITFIYAKEPAVHPSSLPDLIAEALMQKIRQEEKINDENGLFESEQAVRT